MDFTHFGNAAMAYKIPFFKERMDAIVFATQVRWIPVVYDMLKERHLILQRGGDPGWDFNIKDNPLEYSHQMKMIEGAMSLMNAYRRENIKGDNAMNSIWFNSNQEAIRFAQRHKWDEPVLKILVERLRDLSYDAYDRHIGWMLAGQTSKNNMYYDQWYRTDLCVRIMQNYKRKGIKPDPAMVGSVVFASSIPWGVK